MGVMHTGEEQNDGSNAQERSKMMGVMHRGGAK